MNQTGYDSGMTLIEVSLALLVASIGLLAIMALFPSGIAMNKASGDETRAAMFAEEIFNGIRAQAVTSKWANINTGIDLPPPTPHMWDDWEDLRISPTDVNFEKLRFKTTGKGQVYEDFVMRYRLQIEGEPDDDLKSVILEVKPGEFGEDVVYRYYTELYNHGQQ